MPTTEEIVGALRHVIDPEIGIDVVDLGLVYGLEIRGAEVRVLLAMTTPTCPLSEYLVAAAQRAIADRASGVGTVIVEIVHDPPWEPVMMSDAARQRLGWGG